MKDKQKIIEEWDNLSFRDKVEKIGYADIEAVLDFWAEGSWDRKQVEDELARMQLKNIDLAIQERDEMWKNAIENSKKDIGDSFNRFEEKLK